MADNNKVEQKVSLETKGYTDALRKLKAEAKAAVSSINSELFNNSKMWEAATNGVKTATSSMAKELKDLGKASLSNAGKGAVLGGAAVAGVAVKNSFQSAIGTTMSFDKSLARLAYSANVSKSKLADLRKQMVELAGTGVNIDELPDVVNDLYKATGNLDQGGNAKTIAQFSAAGGMDARDVTGFVTQRLTGEGKQVNAETISELLNAVVQTQKSGNFKSYGDTVSAFQGVDADKLRQSKLSEKEYGGLLSAASRAGGTREQSAAAVNQLIEGLNTGFAKSPVLRGILGAGSFMKDGKVNIDSFRKAARGRAGMDDAGLKQLLSNDGMSEQAVTGLMAILKNVDKFAQGIEQQRKATDTVAEAFEIQTDNIEDNAQKLQGKISAAFSDILTPLTGPFSDLAKGNVSKGLAGLPGGAYDSAKSAVTEHPGATVAGLATLAGGAVLAKSVSKILFGGGGGLLGGTATGLAMKQAGVTPVFVTNMGDMGGGVGGLPDILKKGGGAAAGGGLLSFLPSAGTMGMAGLAAGIGLAAGKAVETIGQSDYNPFTFDKGVHPSKANTSDQLAAKFDEFISMFKALPMFNEGLTTKIEVASVEPGYVARPKASDNPRDARGFN